MTAMALPKVRLTPSAVEQLAASLRAGDSLRLSIDEAFGHDLVVGPRHQGDLVLEVESLRLLVDAASAGRADGLTIDFVAGDATGFRFRNPNAPPSVEGTSPKKVKDLLDERKVELFDVRTGSEAVLSPFRE
jgi:monothiol glutaredoxin